MTDLHLRLSEQAASHLAALLTVYGNKTDVGHAALAALHAKHFPASVWGFVKIIPGDIDVFLPELGDDPDRAAKCPDCDHPLVKDGVYLAFHSDGTFALTCRECVRDFNG